MTCNELSDLLSIQRFNFGSELDLQDGIESVLCGAGLTLAEFKDQSIGQGEYGREVKIERGRIDFLVGDIGVEIKIGGSLQAAKLVEKLQVDTKDRMKRLAENYLAQLAKRGMHGQNLPRKILT